MNEVDSEQLKELAATALETLAWGNDPNADSAYGYEHMGDMSKDLRTLAIGIEALLADRERLTQERERLEAFYVEKVKGEAQRAEVVKGHLAELREALRQIAALEPSKLFRHEECSDHEDTKRMREIARAALATVEEGDSPK